MDSGGRGAIFYVLLVLWHCTLKNIISKINLFALITYKHEYMYNKAGGEEIGRETEYYKRRPIRESSFMPSSYLKVGRPEEGEQEGVSTTDGDQ